jgi:exopolysaccharide biosynthesis WecB/TagA/CpsF family protein
MHRELLGLPFSAELTKKNVLEAVILAIEKNENVNFTFINPHSYYVARFSSSYPENLNRFDGVMADGIGVVVASRALGLQTKERVSFDSTSLAPEILKYCSDKQLGVFLVGGNTGVAEQAAKTLCGQYPNLIVSGTNSGYFEDVRKVFDKIKSSGAKVVIAGMGAPLQEDFLVSLKRCGWKGAGFTCGGYLDQVCDDYHYYPNWIDRLNLRFMYRIIQEPRRMWRRYLIHYQTFLKLFLSEYLTRSIKKLNMR